MPIYEYQCEKCSHQLEAMQKFSDPALTHCPECSQETLKKLVSSASFQLKGTGWYVTDFKDKGKPNVADGKPAAAKSEPAKTESAPKESAKPDKASGSDTTSSGE